MVRPARCLRPGVSARYRLPAADTVERRIVAGAVANLSVPTVQRERVPARERPVELGVGIELGGHGFDVGYTADKTVGFGSVLILLSGQVTFLRPPRLKSRRGGPCIRELCS